MPRGYGHCCSRPAAVSGAAASTTPRPSRPSWCVGERSIDVEWRFCTTLAATVAGVQTGGGRGRCAVEPAATTAGERQAHGQTDQQQVATIRHGVDLAKIPTGGSLVDGCGKNRVTFTTQPDRRTGEGDTGHDRGNAVRIGQKVPVMPGICIYLSGRYCARQRPRPTPRGPHVDRPRGRVRLVKLETTRIIPAFSRPRTRALPGRD